MKEKVNEFNNMYKNVLDNIDSYVYISDCETDEIMYINKKLSDSVDAPKDYIGKKCFDVLKGESTRCINCPKKNMDSKQADEIFEWEDRDPIRGGYLRNKGNIIDCGDGRLAFMMQSSNVTETKRMQKEFDITKQRLEIAVKSSGIGIWDVNMKEYTISFDSEFSNIYGIPKNIKSPVSMNEWFGYLENIEIGNGSEQLCNFIKSEGINDFNGATDITHKAKDGLVVFSRAYSTPLYDEDGNLDHILGMTWNITQDIEKNHKMKEIQDRLSIALKSSNAGVWEISFENNTISFDSIFAKLHRIKSESPMDLDKFCKYSIGTVSSEHGEYIKVLERRLQGLSDIIGRTYKHIFDNQEIKYLSNTIRVFKNEYGKSERIIGMVTDVTELRLAELDIEERLKQQKMMADIAQRFVKIENINSAFVDALEMIANFLRVNSAYIYRYNREEDIFELSHNWTADSVDLESINVETMDGEFIRKYVLQSEYNISTAEEMIVPSGEMNDNEGEELQFSHLNVPLYIQDRLWGFAGVSNIRKPRYWTDSDKNMLYLFSGLVDTAMGREIAEENFKMSERTLQAVFNVLHISIFWKNAETGVFEGCNDAFLRLIDKKREEVIGKTNAEIYINKQFAMSCDREDEKVLQMDEPFFYYTEGIRPSGETSTVKVSKSVIRDSEGNPIRLVGSAEDITENRNMELIIQEALENQELAVKNFDGILMSIGNDRIIKLFGGTSMYEIDEENIVGKNYNDVYNEVQVMKDALEKAFWEGSCEFLIQREGRTRQCQLTTIFDSDGEQKGILFVGRDITELYDTQKKLEKAIIEAEEASKAKSDFLARMSHEIRTPMNAIIGMTRIGMDAEEEERRQYCLNRIDVASANLLDIINQILDMSKIEANKLELDTVEFNLKKMINSICMVMGIKVEEKSQKLRVIYETDFNNTLIGDEIRITQVITNLLSNSIKFTPEQGEIEIRIEEIEKDDKLLLKISIADNGIGIDEKQKERIFHSFEQADGSTSRKFGGTGLGLAICKKIVEMMSGEIWVESELGEGATFIFTIQLERGASILENDTVERELEQSATLFGKEILLVEDVDINREIVITLLMEFGVKADIAINGRQAVEMFKENPEKYDLILMDIQMPEMDGYEATRCIRSLPYEYASKVGIIAMTANVFKEDVEKCLEAGMNEHISKPIDVDDMQEKIVKYIR